MTIRAVIFDLDDTLLRTIAVKWAHHKEVARRFYGIELTDDDLRRHWGLPLNQLIPILYQGRDTFENLLAANRSLEQDFLKTAQARAVDVVHALLEIGMVIGVVTATLKVFAEADLIRVGFPFDRFAFVQTADETTVHKPNPAVFAPALAHLGQSFGIAPAEAVYVGDALADFQAARAGRALSLSASPPVSSMNDPSARPGLSPSPILLKQLS